MTTTFAVAGKGGTGKTTIAALIVKHLKERHTGAILALDADPDANLGTVLGIPVEKSIGDLREETLKQMKDFPAGTSKEGYIQAGLHGLIAESERIDLITMGRSEGPGCYCYINSILRKFAEDIESTYRWIVMDNEAGLEHLSRRTTFRVDNLLVVVNSSPLSLDCARRVGELVLDLKNKVGRLCVVANGVSEAQAGALKLKIEDPRIAGAGREMEWAGWIPRDEQLEQACMDEKPVLGPLSTPATAALDEIVARMALQE